MKFSKSVILTSAFSIQLAVAGNLSDELAQERGLKTKQLNLLGSSKSAPVKPQVKSCGTQTSTTEGMRNTTKAQGEIWSLDGREVDPKKAPESVLSMKQSLLDVSRMAADLRFKAAQKSGQNKKSCNTAIFE